MLNDYLKSPRDVRLELGGTAKAERLRQNLTQEALAHAAGISLSTLRRFEKTGDIALASFVEIGVRPAPHGRVRRPVPRTPGAQPV